MSGRDKDIIIGLRRSLKIAKDCLTEIAYGQSAPIGRAEMALERIQEEELKIFPTPLQGLCGHERLRR